jgi:hypothetical protein
MNSERGKRQQLAKVLRNELETRLPVHKQSEQTIEALRSAEEILSEVPKAVTPCELTLRIWQESLTMHRADCSECGATVLGFESFWKYAPCCGASITKVITETDPRQRLERAAVQEAVNQLTGAR